LQQRIAGNYVVAMHGGKAESTELPDHGEATEPECPVCGETLILDRCPLGHTEDPLLAAKAADKTREKVGEFAEDS
jgi:hypothetical protein